MPAETASTGARVLREILRTPAFREIIRLHLDGRDGADPGAAIRVLLSEEPELPLRAASVSPAAIDAAVHSALALGRQLRQYPEPMLQAYLERIAEDIDTCALRELPETWVPILARSAPWLLGAVTATVEALVGSLAGIDSVERARLCAAWAEELDGARLGRAINATAQMVLSLHRETPDLELWSGFARDMVRAADFGLVRQSAEALSVSGRQAGLAIARSVVGDPMAVANVLVTAPPLINDLLALLAGTLEEVKLPDEVLASAVLGVVGRIHASDVGRITTALARTIEAIHRGSAVLGDTEPALRTTAAELLDDLLLSLDGASVHRAMVALGEDGETLAGVLSDLLRQRPDLLGSWAGTAAATQAPLLRGAAAILREANVLPDEAFSNLGQQLRHNLDVDAAVLLARELAIFAERYVRTHPGAPLIRQLSEVARRERLGEAGAALARTLADQLVDEGGLGKALEPGIVGRRLNRWMVNLRGALEQGRDGPGDYLERLLAVIDLDELERTWGAMVQAASRALKSNPGTVRAMVRPVVQAGWSTVRERLEQRQPLLPRLKRKGRRFRWRS